MMRYVCVCSADYVCLLFFRRRNNEGWKVGNKTDHKTKNTNKQTTNNYPVKRIVQNASRVFTHYNLLFIPLYTIDIYIWSISTYYYKRLKNCIQFVTIARSIILFSRKVKTKCKID